MGGDSGPPGLFEALVSVEAKRPCVVGPDVEGQSVEPF